MMCRGTERNWDLEQASEGASLKMQHLERESYKKHQFQMSSKLHGWRLHPTHGPPVMKWSSIQLKSQLQQNTLLQLTKKLMKDSSSKNKTSLSETKGHEVFSGQRLYFCSRASQNNLTFWHFFMFLWSTCIKWDDCILSVSFKIWQVLWKS